MRDGGAHKPTEAFFCDFFLDGGFDLSLILKVRHAFPVALSNDTPLNRLPCSIGEETSFSEVCKMLGGMRVHLLYAGPHHFELPT